MDEYIPTEWFNRMNYIVVIDIIVVYRCIIMYFTNKYKLWNRSKTTKEIFILKNVSLGQTNDQRRCGQWKNKT